MTWLANLPGWREILLILILLVVLYMLWLIWRMRRIGRLPPPTPVRRNEPSWRTEAHDGDDGDDDGNEEEALTYARPRPRRNPFLSSEAKRDALHQDSAVRQDDVVRQDNAIRQDRQELAQQAFMAGVERELLQMREEMDALRGAFAALRSDMESLRDACEQEAQNLRMAQNASPLYSDAMQMAVLGHDAITIAERCGISRAEAELVVSLVKSKDKS
jgi:hypothetical protein